MRPRNQIQQLAGLTWAAGATQPVHLAALPKRHLVRSLALHCTVSGTCDAADVLDRRAFARALAQLSLADHLLPLTGYQLSHLLHKIDGKEIVTSGDIAAGAVTFEARFRLRVPFSDPRRRAPAHPDETAMPSELLAGHDLLIQWAPAAVYGGVAIVITAGTCRVYADICALRDGEEAVVPELRQIRAVGGSQDVTLESGAYVDMLCSLRDALTLVTAANMTGTQVTVEGYPVCPQLPSVDARAAWDESWLTDRAQGLGVADAGSYWVPVIGPELDGRAIRQPIVRGNGGRVTSTGTLTAPQYVCWVSRLKGAGDVLSAADRMGLSNVSSFEPASSGLTDVEASILPATLPGTGSPRKSGLSGAPRPYSRD